MHAASSGQISRGYLLCRVGCLLCMLRSQKEGWDAFSFINANHCLDPILKVGGVVQL